MLRGGACGAGPGRRPAPVRPCPACRRPGQARTAGSNFRRAAGPAGGDRSRCDGRTGAGAGSGGGDGRAHCHAGTRGSAASAIWSAARMKSDSIHNPWSGVGSRQGNDTRVVIQASAAAAIWSAARAGGSPRGQRRVLPAARTAIVRGSPVYRGYSRLPGHCVRRRTAGPERGGQLQVKRDGRNGRSETTSAGPHRLGGPARMGGSGKAAVRVGSPPGLAGPRLRIADARPGPHARPPGPGSGRRLGLRRGAGRQLATPP